MSLQNERRLQFEHERIDDSPPAARMSFCLTTDLTGNGRPDVIVGAVGRKAPVTVPILNKRINLGKLAGTREIIDRLEWNVFWYENPGWERHDVARSPELSVGAALGDIDGDGRAELVTGQNLNKRELYWFEQGEDPRDRWTRRLIPDDFEKYHDVAVADVDGDGEDELVVTEGDLPYQGDRRARLGVFDPPDWELTVLHDDMSNPHSLQVADLDDDGRKDIFVAEMGLEEGHEPRQFVFWNEGDGSFDSEVVASGVPTHEAKLVDLDDDGRLDVVGKGYAHRTVDAWYRS